MRKGHIYSFFWTSSLVLTVAIFFNGAALGQGSGFNFQGRLNDGSNPANGRYDLQFRLYDAITGGNPIGAVVPRPNTTLINGVFSVMLDFGAAAFNSPNSIFIEIAIRPNGSPNAFTILGPRQQLTVVPFAVRAASATNADTATLATNAQHSIDAQIAVNATNAITATNSLSLGGVAPAGWARLNTQNTGDILLTGKLQITGDATQSLTSNGMVKAMLVVAFGQIVRCYNGTTGSSNGNCGFTITTPLSGVYRINYNFPVSNRFVSVTAEYDNSSISGKHNNGANYRQFDSTSIEVFTFIADGGEDTFPINEFTIVMF